MPRQFRFINSICTTLFVGFATLLNAESTPESVMSRREWSLFSPAKDSDRSDESIRKCEEELYANYPWLRQAVQVYNRSYAGVTVYRHLNAAAAWVSKTVKSKLAVDYEALWLDRPRPVDATIELFEYSEAEEDEADSHKNRFLRLLKKKSKLANKSAALASPAWVPNGLVPSLVSLNSMFAGIVETSIRKRFFSTDLAGKILLIEEMIANAEDISKSVDLSRYQPNRFTSIGPVQSAAELLAKVLDILNYHQSRELLAAAVVYNQLDHKNIRLAQIEQILAGGESSDLRTDHSDLLAGWLDELQISPAEFADAPRQTKVLRSFRIREASPALALFRGAVAKDCSSCGSENYALLPSTRFFFVWSDGDPDVDAPNAYIQLVRVSSKAGTNNYILSDINGTLDSRITEAVLRYFQSSGPSIGISKIGAIQTYLRASRINNPRTLEALETYFARAPESVKLVDKSLRDTVDTTREYDKSVAFTGWHPIDVEAVEKIAFLVRDVRDPLQPLRDATEFGGSAEDLADESYRELEESMVLLSSFIRAGNPSKTTDTDPKLLPWLNVDAMNIADFREQFRDFLKAEFDGLNKSDRKKVMPLALMGFFNAPDIDQDIKLLQSSLAILLRMNPAHPLIEQKYLGREDLHDFWRSELMVVLDRMPYGLRMFDIALQRGVFDRDPKAKVQVVLRLMVLQAQSSDVDWRAYLEMIPEGVAVELGADLVNYIVAALKNGEDASEDFCRAALILLSKISSESLIAMDEVYRDRIKKQLSLSIRLEKNKDILMNAITLFAKHRVLYHDDEVERLFSKLKQEAKYDKLHKFRKSLLMAALSKEQPRPDTAIDCENQF